MAGKVLGARRRWVAVTALCIILVAGALRLANIGWSYSNNGIDEGVMIERALMVDNGFALYTSLPCDQAPLAFIFGSVFGGDVVSLRVMTALLSMFALVSCMHVSRRIGGNVAMLAAGALLAVDFALVRESRLFSLDAMSASFLAFSSVAFVMYLERRVPAFLALAGFLAGIACSFKLIGVLALAGILLFIAFEAFRGRLSTRTAMTDAVVVSAAAAVPIAALMIALGPSEMVQGMVFDQGHREFDVSLKLSLLVFFGLNVAFAMPLACAKRLWQSGPRERFLLSLTAIVLLFMVFQPLVFLHHMVFLSPALAVLAGVVASRSIESKKPSSTETPVKDGPKWACLRRAALPVLVISIVISGSLSSYGLLAQDEPAQVVWGEIVEQQTTEGDYVICGDPIIAAYASRMMPPEVVNVAVRQYPELTLDRLCGAVTEYDVSLVLVCYHLNDFEGFPAFLESEGFVRISPDSVVPDGKAVLDLFQDGIDPVSLYVRAPS